MNLATSILHIELADLQRTSGESEMNRLLSRDPETISSFQGVSTALFLDDERLLPLNMAEVSSPQSIS